MRGETTSKTASFTYISYCDTITTQLLNWSESSEIAKSWNRPKTSVFGVVWFFDGVKPVGTVPVLFEAGPGTNPPIWNGW